MSWPERRKAFYSLPFANDTINPESSVAVKPAVNKWTARETQVTDLGRFCSADLTAYLQYMLLARREEKRKKKITKNGIDQKVRLTKKSRVENTDGCLSERGWEYRRRCTVYVNVWEGV